MNRWQTEFKNSNFEKLLIQISEKINEIDITNLPDINSEYEILRLKKVSNSFNSLFSQIDIDIYPKTAWQNNLSYLNAIFQDINNYVQNKNISHIQNANNNYDICITTIASNFNQINSVENQELFKSIIKELNKLENSIIKESKYFIEKIKENHSQTEIIKNNTENFDKKIKDLENEIFHGSENTQPIEKIIKENLEQSNKRNLEINSLYESLSTGENSLRVKIEKESNEIKETKEKIITAYESALKHKKQLDEFYEKIYGTQNNNESGTQEKGLNNYLNEKIRLLEQYEKDQFNKHDAIFAQINTLLPGATSAGLASAYKVMKDKFDKPIKIYTLTFYIALSSLFIFSFFVLLDKFTFSPFEISMVQPKQWDEMLRTLLSRAPIILPIIWLAIFSGTRRSQYERLYQEYAHKEALASSYESYRNQIKQLNTTSEDLQKELLSKAIDAISFNASKTLDGKHSEKPPTSKIFESIDIEKLKQLKSIFSKPSSD